MKSNGLCQNEKQTPQCPAHGKSGLEMVRLVMATIAAVAQAAPLPVDRELLILSEGLPPSATVQHDGEAAVVQSASGAALRVSGPASDRWPGIVLRAPTEAWDFAQYSRLVMDVRNVGNAPTRIGLRFDDQPETSPPKFRYAYKDVLPGSSEHVEVAIHSPSPTDVDGTPIELPGMWAGPWGNLPRGPAAPQQDVTRVSRILIYAGRPQDSFAFEVSNLRLTAAPVWNPPDGKPFLPFVDRFGQYVHQQWPGKMRTEADFAVRLEREKTDLALHPRPTDSNAFGGWRTGPMLEATGAFRTQKVDGKWWLVDPAGKLFFSYGITSIRLDAKKTPVTPDRDRWFRWIPAKKDPVFGAFLGPCHAWSGPYKHQKMTGFSFGQANMRRRYGTDWQPLAREMAHSRLHSWGLNTIGNWSDITMCTMQKTPYTVGFYIPTANYVGDKSDHNQRFPDVHDPSWEQGLRRVLKRWYGGTLNDPWCIGYFVDNELEFAGDVIPSGTLASPADQPAKRAFVDLLRSRHHTIDSLNAAWGTQHASWDAVCTSRELPDPERARTDFSAFLEQVAKTYFSTIKRVLREMAPGRLYLGSRFNTFNRIPATVAATYCDVVSYNLYRYPEEVAAFTFPGKQDVPLIIGEWHFGARDRGVFFPGLREARDQADRARLLMDYMRAVLAHPQFVGAHWFRYRSEPCTGRDLDGENGQLGFVDICDSPYAETVAASRTVGHTMYPFRWTGKWTPQSSAP
mgnify:CR=1 FL=1